MVSPLRLDGVYVPLITPFTSDDRIALPQLEALTHRYLDAGAAGIVALGTTGEPATLEESERRSIIEVVGSVCREREAALIVGAGTNSTKATLEAVRVAGLTPGLTAVLSVVPYYTRPSEAGIVAHFKQVAAASTVPVILYNIPYRTGRGLGAGSLLELAETPNIAGLKQAVGGVDMDTLRLLAEKPEDFHVLCGDDAFLFSLMALGATGAIAASAHVCTESFVRLVDEALKGDVEPARVTADTLLPVCSALFEEPSPGVVKGVLHAQGLIPTPALRGPMTAASGAAVDKALAAIDAVP